MLRVFGSNLDVTWSPIWLGPPNGPARPQGPFALDLLCLGTIVLIDYPSNHPDNRIPVLDIAKWNGKIDVNGENQKKILHSHFMKEMSSRLVIGKDSAPWMRLKLNIFVADLVRVMRNVSTHYPTEELDKHVQYYVWRMQYSGYKSDERLQVYRGTKGK